MGPGAGRTQRVISGHTTPQQRHHYIKMMSRRRFDVMMTLLLRRVPAGVTWVQDNCFYPLPALGIGNGLMYLTSMVTVQHYFDKRRALATGLAVSGSGMGMLVFGFLTQFLLDSLGWRNTVRVEVCCSPVSLHKESHVFLMQNNNRPQVTNSCTAPFSPCRHCSYMPWLVTLWCQFDVLWKWINLS